MFLMNFPQYSKMMACETTKCIIARALHHVKSSTQPLMELHIILEETSPLKHGKFVIAGLDDRRVHSGNILICQQSTLEALFVVCKFVNIHNLCYQLIYPYPIINGYFPWLFQFTSG